MAYKDEEIKRHLWQQRVKKDRPSIPGLEDDKRRRRLEADILALLQKVDDREYFVKEVEKITARSGLQMGLKQRERALRLFDQYVSQRKKPSR